MGDEKEKKKWWTVLLFGALAAIVGAVAVNLLDEVMVMPWQAQTKALAKEEHKELDAKHVSKEDHKWVQTFHENRLESLETADKLRVEQMDKVEEKVGQIEKDTTEMKFILRELRKKL